MLDLLIVFDTCAFFPGGLELFPELEEQTNISSENFVDTVSSYHSCVGQVILYFPSHHKACAFGRDTGNSVLRECLEYILDKE